jgi:hypothetical protein
MFEAQSGNLIETFFFLEYLPVFYIMQNFGTYCLFSRILPLFYLMYNFGTYYHVVVEGTFSIYLHRTI